MVCSSRKSDSQAARYDFCLPTYIIWHELVNLFFDNGYATKILSSVLALPAIDVQKNNFKKRSQ